MKEKQITRTFTVTNAEVLSLNVETKETCVSQVKKLGKLTAREMLNILRDECEDNPVKPVSILQFSHKLERRAMAESIFLKYSEEVPLLKGDGGQDD